MSVIIIEKMISLPKSSEIIERKGIGHPDTLADIVAEQASIDYSKWCKKEFGVILHHNLDKVYVRGGPAVQDFGGESLIDPITVRVGGRVTTKFGQRNIPYKEILVDATRRAIQQGLPNLDVNDPKQLNIIVDSTNRSARKGWYEPRDRRDLPEAKGKPRSNDTVAVVGFFPPTPAEMLAHKLEGFFYRICPENVLRPRWDFFGQDIKVMIRRDKKKVTATLCVPQVSNLTPSYFCYQERIEQLEDEINLFAQNELKDFDVKVQINPARHFNPNHRYLVTYGSSADFGEEGFVGRGNQVYGLVSSLRPHSSEAPFGKNPVYFGGKVGAAIAQSLAKGLADSVGGSFEVCLQYDQGCRLDLPNCLFVRTTDHSIEERDIEKGLLACGDLDEATSNIIEHEIFLPSVSFPSKDKYDSIHQL